jgi:hypothetical protein
LFSTTEQRDNQVEVHLVVTAVAKALGFPLPPFIFICSSRSSGSHLEDDALTKVVKKAAFARTVAALGLCHEVSKKQACLMRKARQKYDVRMAKGCDAAHSRIFPPIVRDESCTKVRKRREETGRVLAELRSVLDNVIRFSQPWQLRPRAVHLATQG